MPIAPLQQSRQLLVGASDDFASSHTRPATTRKASACRLPACHARSGRPHHGMLAAVAAAGHDIANYCSLARLLASCRRPASGPHRAYLARSGT